MRLPTEYGIRRYVFAHILVGCIIKIENLPTKITWKNWYAHAIQRSGFALKVAKGICLKIPFRYWIFHFCVGGKVKFQKFENLYHIGYNQDSKKMLLIKLANQRVDEISTKSKKIRIFFGICMRIRKILEHAMWKLLSLMPVSVRKNFLTDVALWQTIIKFENILDCLTKIAFFNFHFSVRIFANDGKR